MIRPLTILCCDEFFQDITSRKISLINLFDEINSPAYPTVHNRFGIWVKVERNNDDLRYCVLEMSFSIGGENILIHNVNIDFVDALKHDVLIKVGAINLPRSGELIVTATVGEANTFTTLFLRVTE